MSGVEIPTVDIVLGGVLAVGILMVEMVLGGV
jgi:hypothetical protein